MSWVIQWLAGVKICVISKKFGPYQQRFSEYGSLICCYFGIFLGIEEEPGLSTDSLETRSASLSQQRAYFHAMKSFILFQMYKFSLIGSQVNNHSRTRVSIEHSSKDLKAPKNPNKQPTSNRMLVQNQFGNEWPNVRFPLCTNRSEGSRFNFPFWGVQNGIFFFLKGGTLFVRTPHSRSVFVCDQVGLIDGVLLLGHTSSLLLRKIERTFKN